VIITRFGAEAVGESACGAIAAAIGGAIGAAIGGAIGVAIGAPPEPGARA
jgi:hypothetical protein